MQTNQMIRKCLAIGIILMFLGTCIIPATAQDIEKPSQSTSRDNWLYVGGNGPGNYSIIQDAVDNASDGDTVFVYSQGSPYFENLIVNRSISLIGEDKNSTIIDAGNIGNGVILRSDGIVLSGFTFQNANDSWEVALVKLFSNDSIISNNIINGARQPDFSIYAGIEVRGARNLIIENLVYDNWVGIVLDQASSNIISNNTVFHSPYGIYASESPYNVITGNTISDISTYLVDLEDSSDYCQVTGNFLYNGSTGVWVISTSNISIIGNTMFNLGEGVQIGSAIVSGFFHNISQNTIYDCMLGILMCYGTSSIISGNRIWNCGGGIADVDGSYEILSRNIVAACKYGINIVSPEKGNLVSRNELRDNRIGIEAEIHYNTVKVTENNLIDNNRSIFFYQVFPYLGQVPGNLAIDGNYYSDRHGSGPKLLFGWIVILDVFIFPYIYFHIPFPRFLCDWHPAQEPYDVPGMS